MIIAVSRNGYAKYDKDTGNIGYTNSTLTIDSFFIRAETIYLSRDGRILSAIRLNTGELLGTVEYAPNKSIFFGELEEGLFVEETGGSICVLDRGKNLHKFRVR